MKTKIALIIILSINLNLIAQEFQSLTSNHGQIEWTTSSWGNGFGHKIYGQDPGGKTLLNIAVRHNSSSWVDLMTFTSNGNVGIGTTNPSAKFHIYGNNTPVSMKILGGTTNSNSATINLGVVSGRDWELVARKHSPTDGYALGFNHKTNDYQGPITFSWMDKEKVRIQPNGNLGIGTTSPSEKLELFHSTTSPSIISLKSIRNDAQWVDVGRLVAKQGATEVARIGMPRGTGTNTGFLTFWTKETNEAQLVESMRIHPNGNVGIGTTTPDSKLAVNGRIHAKEVKVDLEGWSDFVFYNDYKLPTLIEVENHIKEKGHLKDIPNAEEVAKNGIELGKMDAKLLQKIEELTLYTIQQEKKIKALEKQNSKINKQEKEIKELKELVQKLLLKGK